MDTRKMITISEEYFNHLISIEEQYNAIPELHLTRDVDIINGVPKIVVKLTGSYRQLSTLPEAVEMIMLGNRQMQEKIDELLNSSEVKNGC